MRQGLDKKAVLLAAAKIADEQGFDQVTLASVAQKLNIRTPSLYNHVEGLPGLKKELACYAMRKLKEVLVEAAIGRTGEDVVYSLGFAYVSFVRAHPGLYETTMGAPDPLDSDVRAVAEEIVALLLRALDSYGFDHEEAMHTVRGLRSIVHGFATLELKKGFTMDFAVDETLKHVLHTYVLGLREKKERQVK